ncbi:hypothetical protein ACFSOZ_18980 [Mesorhizobium newzealandense]|uniref:Uncharacterized protein n=3 Tax=Mesorhizobium TaxID=68287 RepID=A0ABW4W9I4_9HYPH|nr:hypothetical protein [Mesorhizobium sophorae]
MSLIGQEPKIRTVLATTARFTENKKRVAHIHSSDISVGGLPEQVNDWERQSLILSFHINSRIPAHNPRFGNRENSGII